MFIPYGTDAPIYHWPYATLVVIAINVAVFIVQSSMPVEPPSFEGVEYTEEEIEEMSDEEVEELKDEIIRQLTEEMSEEPGWYKYALSHGDGLHPVQWLTSFLIHGGVGHLIGNMLFLWAFGIVIEGKLGPWLFTATYFGMGLFQNMTEQILFLGTPALPSLGASSVIYGLMVMAMLWAPRDNLLCLIFIWIQPILFSIPILIFAFLYLFMDFGSAMFSGFVMSTALLHVMGGLVGLIPAVLLLTLNVVDCEHHDLFSLIREAAGKELKEKPVTRKQKTEAEKKLVEDRAHVEQQVVQTRKSIDAHLNAGNLSAAVNVMTNFRRRGGKAQWGEQQLLTMIRLAQQDKGWDGVIEYSNEYLAQFAEHSASVRINLAKVLLLEKSFPRKAIRALELVDQTKLSEKQRKVFQQIVTRGREMIDDGTIELDDG